MQAVAGLRAEGLVWTLAWARAGAVSALAAALTLPAQAGPVFGAEQGPDQADPVTEPALEVQARAVAEAPDGLPALAADLLADPASLPRPAGARVDTPELALEPESASQPGAAAAASAGPAMGAARVPAPPLVKAAQAEPVPVPPGDEADPALDLAATRPSGPDPEKRQAQRDAIVWTVVPLVLLAMGVWAFATRRRTHKKRPRRRSGRQRA